MAKKIAAKAANKIEAGIYSFCTGPHLTSSSSPLATEELVK